MPLVVPGVTAQSGDKTEEWSNKLVGKTLSDDTTNETVGWHSELGSLGNWDSEC
jgi:hypothetical protein